MEGYLKADPVEPYQMPTKGSKWKIQNNQRNFFTLMIIVITYGKRESEETVQETRIQIYLRFVLAFQPYLLKFVPD